MTVISGTAPRTRNCLVCSFFNSIRNFFLKWFGPRRLCLVTGNRPLIDGCCSLAVNRPLVGELTPVTLLVCSSSSRLPSRSPGQLMSFSQKSDGEQVVAVQSGMWTDVFASRNCPPSLRTAAWVRIWLSTEKMGENKIISRPSNICTASWRQLPVIEDEKPPVWAGHDRTEVN